MALHSPATCCLAHPGFADAPWPFSSPHHHPQPLQLVSMLELPFSITFGQPWHFWVPATISATSSGNRGNPDLARWCSWSHHNIILSRQWLITNYMHTVALRWYYKLDITLLLQYEMIKIWQGDCSYLWSGYEVHSGITAFMSDVGHFTNV